MSIADLFVHQMKGKFPSIAEPLVALVSFINVSAVLPGIRSLG
jgi:hypothetical protein